jgi:hypothetical protein
MLAYVNWVMHVTQLGYLHTLRWYNTGVGGA